MRWHQVWKRFQPLFLVSMLYQEFRLLSNLSKKLRVSLLLDRPQNHWRKLVHILYISRLFHSLSSKTLLLIIIAVPSQFLTGMQFDSSNGIAEFYPEVLKTQFPLLEFQVLILLSLPSMRYYSPACLLCPTKQH